ncbi:hypothetical protein [Thalassoglobus sp.]|uniref:hypothetical protein n=1 Tax=Thalassoglobus sp. TaxID=2795869 RepID=UPI003AA8C3E6
MIENRPKIAIGPESPGFGSWEWVGQDLVDELEMETVETFRDVVPSCDIAVFIKFKPPYEQLCHLRERCHLVYCPVDIYGSAAEIDLDSDSLSVFDCLITHASALTKYFSPYARVELVDHHVKYVAPLPTKQKTSGPVLWTGNASNLTPLVQWSRQNRLPEELWILTNLQQDALSPDRLGFNSYNRVRSENWSPERHREWAQIAQAAIDIKGKDFRARHKPPTKAYDFIASGLPLAMNAESRPIVDVAQHGLQLVEPTDIEQWFSKEYWEATQLLGQKLNRELSRSKVAQKLLRILYTL